MKRIERKVETGGQSGKMINDTTMVYGIDKDPRFTIRAGAALIHASEDNVDRIMIDLEQSKKYAAQLKDTLRREREESNKLKRKFEYMQHEIKYSKVELQFLQVEKRSLEVAQESLEKLQQECQGLRIEKDQLLSKIGELELQKATLEELERQSQVYIAELKEQVTSLAAALEEAREQQVNLQPFKEHVLAQRSKMHKLQVSIEEERCKVF